MAKIRLSIEVSQDVADLLDSIATSEDTTRTEIVRRSLSVLKAFREQQAVGRTHLGFAADPRSLDAEMLGILSSRTGGGEMIPSSRHATVDAPPAARHRNDGDVAAPQRAAE